MDVSTAALASLINGQYTPAGGQRPVNSHAVPECDTAVDVASLHYLSSLQGLLQSCRAVSQSNSNGEALRVASAAPSSAAATSEVVEDISLKASESAPPGVDPVLHAQLQSQLLAALAGTPVQSLNSAQTTADAVKHQSPSPAVAMTDTVQLTALLTVMQEPQDKPRLVCVGRSGSGSSGLDSVSSGRITKTSSPGPGPVYETSQSREKNRQAQQRFRQRQKDRIQQLEEDNKQLQQQLSASKQQLAVVQQQAAVLLEENQLLKSQLAPHVHLLGALQQQQLQQQLEQQSQQR